MLTLSIIIPVYNGEKFLKKCLDSIFKSNISLDLFEVIIINDGTPDRSLNIVTKYTKLYNNITVFSQENKGLGEARNTGIKLVKGEYIWFVDQDDWITPNAIDRICKKLYLNKPDILSFEYRYPSGKRAPIDNRAKVGELYKGKEFLNIHVVENPVWRYVIKSSFMSQNKLFFQKENHEDTLFTPIAFFIADTVIYDDSINYIYNFRENSITTSLAPFKHCDDAIAVAIKLNSFMLENARNYSERKIFSKYIALVIGALFYYWRQLSSLDKKLISIKVPLRLLLKSLFYSYSFKHIIALLIIKLK